MPKFAVYFIPKDSFYELGSRILGYDIRGRSLINSEFNPQWNRLAQPYGFHLTIGDAIDFQTDKLSSIEQELELILKYFNPKNTFELQAHPDKFITRLGKKKEVVALRYTPNIPLACFHSLVATRLNPLGTGSGYLSELEQQESLLEDQNYYRIKHFYSPYILDSYRPHFTLFNPFSGNDFATIERELKDKFSAFHKLTVDSVCLVIQPKAGQNWEIYREFAR